MRILALALLLFAACSQEAAETEPQKGLYAGEGRDRLCWAGERVGFITYSNGDTNCSVRGRIDRAGQQLLSIVPDGDLDCRINVREQGRALVLGDITAACAYYCGPGASFAGRSFSENAASSPAVDFARDPLC